MEMKEFIEKYRRLLPIGNSISTSEAEKRAAMFLEAMATVADWKHEFTKTRIQQLSTQTATYASELSKGTAKTVTENKTTAEASDEYTSAREALEGTENDISYLKTYYEVFQNAHILYRQLSKGDFSG
jgi:transposase